MIEDLAGHLHNNTTLTGISFEQLLQGPFSDALTHADSLPCSFGLQVIQSRQRISLSQTLVQIALI
jgi:hypothetical protein